MRDFTGPCPLCETLPRSICENSGVCNAGAGSKEIFSLVLIVEPDPPLGCRDEQLDEDLNISDSSDGATQHWMARSSFIRLSIN